MTSSAFRAFADAVADMEAEGLAEAVTTYHGSYAIYNARDNEFDSGPIEVDASSLPEAYGLAYIRVREKYADGPWNPPEIKFIDVPTTQYSLLF